MNPMWQGESAEVEPGARIPTRSKTFQEGSCLMYSKDYSG